MLRATMHLRGMLGGGCHREHLCEIAAHVIKLELILAVLALGAAIYTLCFLCLRVVWRGNFKGEQTSTVFITEIKEQKMLTECLAKNTSGFCFRRSIRYGLFVVYMPRYVSPCTTRTKPSSRGSRSY